MNTDLLGDPIAETPAMDAPLPWRVYRMNHLTEWVMARTEPEAIACYLEHWRGCGDSRTEDELRAARAIEDPHELTDAELADEEFWDGRYRRSFALELADRIRTVRVAMFFASTEY